MCHGKWGILTVGPAVHLYPSEPPAGWSASLHPRIKQHHLPSCYQHHPHSKPLSLSSQFSFRLFFSLLPLLSLWENALTSSLTLVPRASFFWNYEISQHPQATSHFPVLFLTYALSLHFCLLLLSPLLFSPFLLIHFSFYPLPFNSLLLFLFSPCPILVTLSARCIAHCAEGKQCIWIQAALYDRSNTMYTYRNSKSNSECSCLPVLNFQSQMPPIIKTILNKAKGRIKWEINWAFKGQFAALSCSHFNSCPAHLPSAPTLQSSLCLPEYSPLCQRWYRHPALPDKQSMSLSLA